MALHVAALNGYTHIVEVLLEEGQAEVNVADEVSLNMREFEVVYN